MLLASLLLLIALGLFPLVVKVGVDVVNRRAQLHRRTDNVPSSELPMHT